MLYYEILSGVSVALAATVVLLAALAARDSRSIGRVQERRLRHLKGLRIGVSALLCVSQAAIVALRMWTHGLPQQLYPADVEKWSSLAAWLTLLVSTVPTLPRTRPPTHTCDMHTCGHGASSTPAMEAGCEFTPLAGVRLCVHPSVTCMQAGADAHDALSSRQPHPPPSLPLASPCRSSSL